MRRGHVRIALIVACAVYVPSAAAAQWRQPEQPPEVIVEQYLSGESELAIRASGYPCPADHPYRDEVFRRLLAVSATPHQDQTFAGGWMTALARCDDARLNEWYHRKAMDADDPYTVLSVGYALAKSRKPANLDVLKEAAFRGDVPEEIREEMLGLAHYVGPVEQINWLVEGYLAGKPIPMGFLETRFHALLRFPAEAGSARRKVLNALLTRPDRPRATRLMTILIGDAQRAAGAESWRSELAAGFQQLAVNPVASEAIRSAAASAAADLQRIRIR